jgi:hypothetical protein
MASVESQLSKFIRVCSSFLKFLTLLKIFTLPNFLFVLFFVIRVVLFLIVMFYVLFMCKCVLPPGGNPTAVDKYININYQYINIFFQISSSYQAGWNRRNIPNSLADGSHFAARRSHRQFYLRFMWFFLVLQCECREITLQQPMTVSVSIFTYQTSEIVIRWCVTPHLPWFFFYFLESGEENVSIGSAASKGPMASSGWRQE